MKTAILQMLDDVNDLREDLKIWVVNKDIPLDERWELFIKSELGESEGWNLNLNSLPRDYVSYDGSISCERYQTMRMEEVIDVLEYQVGNLDSRYVHKDAKYVCIEDVKEEILEKFIKSFTFDW